jgi:hypothetical protein
MAAAAVLMPPPLPSGPKPPAPPVPRTAAIGAKASSGAPRDSGHLSAKGGNTDLARLIKYKSRTYK